MPDPDRRIFDYFRANEDTAEEVDRLAYASYAFSKFEWFDRYVEQNGSEPSQAEIEKWSSELPDSRMAEIHDAAARVFRSAARIYMQDAIRKAEHRAVSESILAEVKRHNEALEKRVQSAVSFWSNVVPNVIVGIVSSLVFAIILIVASLVFVKDPSPLALYKSISPVRPETPER